MHILYLDWPCFGGQNVLFMFEQRGWRVTKFSHPDYLLRVSDSFIKAADEVFAQSDADFDFCFSYNYFPLMARVCKEHDLKYISFVYDSPQVKLYSYTVTYPTNYIFVFDSALVETFRKGGINTFYYMPLPVNGNLIDHLLTKPYDRKRLSAEVSFVGSLYNEEHNFLDRYSGISDYTNGYLQAVMDAQSKVYGYHFMDECLKPDIVDDLQSQVNYSPESDGVETLPYVFDDYFLCRKLTSMERVQLLSAVAAQFPLKLFTLNDKAVIPHAQNMGTADYYKEMPYVFHDSKINLNISLRSIRSGIPLRCMDILGNGGFLLSNYQSDFLRHFTPDEDFVYFENEADLLQKIDYYLSHEEKRAAIAASGHDKVLKYHNFDVIFNEILSIAL
jgi:spore maturation protein CgeB